MRTGVVVFAVLLMAVEVVLAQTSNIQSNFIMSGCELPSGGGIFSGSCSSDGRYFCKAAASGGILQDTITTVGACSLTGGEQCCPAGYICESSGCRLRTTSCTIYSEINCATNNCFWISDGAGGGTCVDRPKDYGCNVYKTSTACHVDIWNLGSIGMGTDACNGEYITNGTLGVVIPKGSCKCTWGGGSCLLSYQAKNDLYTVSAGLASPPDTFTCHKNFSDSSPCVSGKQSVTWGASIASKTGLFFTMDGSHFDTKYKSPAGCISGNKDRVCGYETMKLPGVSLFSLVLALGLLVLFYLYRLPRNDL